MVVKNNIADRLNEIKLIRGLVYCYLLTRSVDSSVFSSPPDVFRNKV